MNNFIDVLNKNLYFIFFRFIMAPRRISHPRTGKYSTFVVGKLKQLRDENILTDFKIQLKETVMVCHKLTLAVHSPVFQVMLTSNMEEVTKQEVKLDHISKDTMAIILDFMYYGDLNLDSSQLLDLVNAAEYLQMDELKSICVAEVPAILEPANAISWRKMANKMELENIKTKCEAIMIGKFQEVSKQTDFFHLHYEELYSYLCDICGTTVKSDDTLDVALRWVNHDTKNRVKHMEALLQPVRLNKCSVQSIKTMIKSYQVILNKETVGKILMDILESKATVLVIGGQVDETLNRVCWNITEANQFEEFCKIPSVDLKCRHSVCKTPQGFAITGGEDSDICIMFLAATRSWLRMQNMLSKRHAHGSSCVKGFLLVLGGYVNGNESCAVDFLMIDEGETWQKGPDLLIAVTYPKVSDIEKDVYLLDEGTTQLLHLDVTKKVWSKRASLLAKGSCRGVSMTSAEGKLFVVGAQGRICSLYNPTTDTWTNSQQTLHRHLYGTLVYYNNKILLLGGCCVDGTDEVEEYNVEDGTWSVTAYKMPAKLCNHHGLVLDFPTHQW